MDPGVFLDTAALVALLNQDEDDHAAATEMFTQFGRRGRRVVTTSFVLAELGNVLARTTLRDKVVWLIKQLDGDPASKVVYVDRAELTEALELYRTRADKSWGLVDCVSFVTMQSMGIREAFTADRHFEQAGFVALLR